MKSNSYLYMKLMLMTIIMAGNAGLLALCVIKSAQKAWNVFLPYFIEESSRPSFGDYFRLLLLVCGTIIVFHFIKMIADKVSVTKDQINTNRKINKKLAEYNLEKMTYNIASQSESNNDEKSTMKDEYKKFTPERLSSRDLKTMDTCVGMIAVKEQVKKIRAMLNYERQFGKSSEQKLAHMVFTGNPGTGKTMIARAVAALLHDAGAIKQPVFMEVNANDLMGEYIGSTAPTVKKAFEKCKNGVLFIDEAYALVQSGRNGYAVEAVNTLLTMLESNPYNVTVIFAGYKSEIESFLNMNPGLRSRIQHTLEFPDYSPEELLNILELNLRKMKHELPHELKPMLINVFEQKLRNCRITGKPFANGRYARNVASHIHTAHAMNYMDNHEIGITIIKEDIDFEDLLRID